MMSGAWPPPAPSLPKKITQKIQESVNQDGKTEPKTHPVLHSDWQCNISIQYKPHPPQPPWGQKEELRFRDRQIAIRKSIGQV